MNKISRTLAVTLLVATIPATIVLAQQAPSGEPAADKPAVEKSEMRHGPSPEVRARLEDGRIAFAKAALKLTPEQEKLWAPVEEKMRANFAEREKVREERKSNREAKGDEAKGEKLALPERIEKRSERLTKQAEKMTERAGKEKEFAEVLKPLFATFSDEQKEVAGRVLSHMGKGDHGRRGPMCAMKRGFGHGHGHGYGHGHGDGPRAE